LDPDTKLLQPPKEIDKDRSSTDGLYQLSPSSSESPNSDYASNTNDYPLNLPMDEQLISSGMLALNMYDSYNMALASNLLNPATDGDIRASAVIPEGEYTLMNQSPVKMDSEVIPLPIPIIKPFVSSNPKRFDSVSRSTKRIDGISSPPKSIPAPPRRDSAKSPDVLLPRRDSTVIPEIIVTEPEPVLEIEQEIRNIPSPHNDQELWVPAYAHPEVNPADFKSWLSSHWEEDSATQVNKPMLRRSSSFADRHVVVCAMHYLLTF
jgi:hypothetical protein